MEEQLFNQIRDRFCNLNQEVMPGRMMSAKAIVYRSRVFAFFSVDKKMVFKLGKEFDPHSMDIDIQVFNPYVKRAPFNGWFEVPIDHEDHWQPLAERAFQFLQKEVEA